MPAIAVIGAGLIGRAWAIVFARAGWDVRVTDPDSAALADAPRLIRQGLDDLAEFRLVDDPAAAAARVRTVSSVAQAVDGVELVQENGPETVDVKRKIFAELDGLAPRSAILA